MEHFKLRVIDEYADLQAKLSKLSDFLYRGKPHKELLEQIGQEEYARMQRQSDAMSMYSDALRERIKEF